MSLTRKLVALALAMVCVVAFQGSSLAESYRVKAVRNAEGNWLWSPDYKGILKGDRIVWKNPATSRVHHTVTAFGGGWSKDVRIDPGETTAKRFRTTGAYFYRCRNHSTLSNGVCRGMCGHIHVSRG